MVKFISPYDSLYVRSMALFNGKPLNEVKLREDDMEGSFHLGFWKQQQIVAVASFFPVGLEGYE
ncbi:MAG: GNAT family N-acetyltransferase, partial [Bacteroidota bacterium]